MKHLTPEKMLEQLEAKVRFERSVPAGTRAGGPGHLENAEAQLRTFKELMRPGNRNGRANDETLS